MQTPSFPTTPPPSPLAVSVVVPVLNEGANLAELLTRLDQTMRAASITYEAIVVDDHSTDTTAAILAELRARDLPVRHLLKNGPQGKAYSLQEGFAAATYANLAMMDGDLQYPPEALPQLLVGLEKADLVIGDRRSHYDNPSPLRGALSRIYDVAINRGLLGSDLDMQSGMKVFKRSLYEQLTLKSGPWSFDVDLITQSLRRGALTKSVPIVYAKRQEGEPKTNPLLVGAELIWQAARIKLDMIQEAISDAEAMGPAETGEDADEIAGVTPTAVSFPPAPPVTDIAVGRYRNWMREVQEQRATAITASAHYFADAQRVMIIGAREIRTFAPFAAARSAFQTLMPGQGVALVLLALLLIVGVIFRPLWTVITVLGGISVLYLVDMLVHAVVAGRTVERPAAEVIADSLIASLAHADWPRYTILCPLYKEVEVVPQFVRAMSALDYPAAQLQILFLTEESDAETRDAILAMGLPAHFTVITVPDGEPRTKPRACNYGLLEATGDFVVIYDAEDIPDPLQLKKAVLAFANHGEDVACVQAKLNFYNTRQNLLTRWFTIEYTTWFDLILPGMQQAGVPLPLGGTSNHFRTPMLRAVGAWDPFNVTEDCDLGLRLGTNHLRTVMLDSTTQEEANSQVGNWLRQRSRWIKGYMQTYLVYMRQPLIYLRAGQWQTFLSLQLLVGGKVLALLVNPIMWALLGIYIAFHATVAPLYHLIFPAPLLYMSVTCLIFGNFLYVYSYLIGCVQRRHFHLARWALLTPIYWAMMSVAALIALQQIITKPHYWEKTRHGLHLQHAQAARTDLPLEIGATTASAE